MWDFCATPAVLFDSKDTVQRLTSTCTGRKTIFCHVQLWQQRTVPWSSITCNQYETNMQKWPLKKNSESYFTIRFHRFLRGIYMFAYVGIRRFQGYLYRRTNDLWKQIFSIVGVKMTRIIRRIISQLIFIVAYEENINVFLGDTDIYRTNDLWKQILSIVKNSRFDNKKEVKRTNCEELYMKIIFHIINDN